MKKSSIDAPESNLRLGWAGISLLCLIPMALLVAGSASAWSYARVADDVNHAGQLRYRSLMARDLCMQNNTGHARAVLLQMQRIRQELRLRHSSLPYFTEADFDEYAYYIEKGEAPPFDVTMHHVESADRFTVALAGAARNYLYATFGTLVAALSTLAVAIAMLLRANRGLLRAERGHMRLAATDSLTGLWNRRRLYTVLSELHETHGRDGSSYAVVLADIDYFKVINDEYGHLRGDEVLVRFAELLGHVPESEAFRYGGEEFAWVLPNFGIAAAVEHAEQLRTRLIKTPLAGLAVTASFGVALAHAGDSVSSVLERADRALYAAKKCGRDRVAIENIAAKPLSTGLSAPSSTENQVAPR